MIPRTSLNFYHNSRANTLDIILQGSSSSIDSNMILKLFNKSKEKGNSVIAFNFPYYERGENKSSGPELKEELESLQKILDFANFKKYSNLRLIAKSLGGIVASYYLESLSEEDKRNISVVIFGYVTGETRLKNFKGKIRIIQGQKDKFGGIDIVKEDLKDSASKDIQYFEVEGADHSFRNPLTKEPIFEETAIWLYSLTF